MENTYGIGITNRYELFYIDDDGSDPLENLMQPKLKNAPNNKTNKKSEKINQTETNKLQTGSDKIFKKSDEKENKSSTLNKNQENQSNKVKSLSSNKSQPNNKIIKDQQQTDGIGKGKDFSKPPTKDNRSFERNNDRVKFDNENREQRNNKRNRDDRQPHFNQTQNGPSEINNRDRDDRPRRGGTSGGGIEGRGNGRRNFDMRGKREFDRQSGSDKTGVKAVDKRDGAGAHNWGSAKQDLEDLNNTKPEWDNEKNVDKDESTEQKEETEQTAPVEEEAKELTLDEWKAKRAVRAKPQYNLRKAGEGEDLSQWNQMVAIEKKKKGEDDEDIEYDSSLYPQRAGRQKHLLDIEFHFNDGRRGGGLGRGRGRSRGGPGGPGRGGPGRNRNPDREGGNAPGVTGGLPSERNERPERGERRGGNRDNDRDHVPRDRYEDRRNNQNAPKVDDEHDFPSLG